MIRLTSRLISFVLQARLSQVKWKKKNEKRRERKKKERQKQIDEFFGGRLGLGYNQYLNKID